MYLCIFIRSNNECTIYELNFLARKIQCANIMNLWKMLFVTKESCVKLAQFRCRFWLHFCLVTSVYYAKYCSDWLFDFGNVFTLNSIALYLCIFCKLFFSLHLVSVCLYVFAGYIYEQRSTPSVSIWFKCICQPVTVLPT